jgi:hypothetical protein
MRSHFGVLGHEEWVCLLGSWGEVCRRSMRISARSSYNRRYFGGGYRHVRILAKLGGRVVGVNLAPSAVNISFEYW